MVMRTIIQLCIYIIFGFNTLFAQQIKPEINSREIQPFIDLKNRTSLWNVNDTSFIRILDGVLLKNTEIIDVTIVNRISKISDIERLEPLGLKMEVKPYMLLNTVLKRNRYLIFQKAGVDEKFIDINLPIVVNNKLITVDNYDELEAVEVEDILQCDYKSSTSVNNKITPMGYVDVLIKNKM